MRKCLEETEQGQKEEDQEQAGEWAAALLSEDHRDRQDRDPDPEEDWERVFEEEAGKNSGL